MTALTPLSGKPGNISSPFFFHKKEEVLIDHSISPSMEWVLIKSRRMRKQNIQKLKLIDEEKALLICELEKSCIELEPLFFETQKAYLPYKKNFDEYGLLIKRGSQAQQDSNKVLWKDNPEEKVLRAQLEKSELKHLDTKEKFEDKGKELIEKYPSLKLSVNFFDSLYADGIEYANFFVNKEQSLNSLVNETLFLSRAERFSNVNKERIIHNFQKEKVLDLQIDANEISKIEVIFISRKDETHNRGRKPVTVKFIFNNSEEFKFILKPRDGVIDKEVIGLFKKINKKTSKNDARLPEYTIFTPDENWEYLKEMGEVSIWEFIDGPRGNDAPVLEEVKKQIPREEIELLERKFNRMDAILTQLSISDLHAENLIISKLDTGRPDIVPVDFENVQWGQPTQLEGKPETVSLTEEEKFIDKLKKKFNTFTIRVLPMGTQALLRFISEYKNNENFTNTAMEILKNQGYILDISKEKFQKLLLRDTLLSDVPYLTELGNKLYYGFPKEGIKIGTR